MSEPSIAILAGGESRRMREDKARLEYKGETFLERIAEAASAVSGEVFVVGRSVDGIASVEDDRVGCGPLGGLETALRRCEKAVAVAACDTPLLEPAAFRWLFEVFDEASAEHGVVTRCDGRLQPLFGVYRASCRTLVESMLDDGRRSMQGLVESGSFDVVDVPDRLEPMLENVNTPKDYRRLLRRR